MKSEKTEKSELCGIEFRTTRDFKRFLALNPMLQAAHTLTSGRFRIIVFTCANFPTRDSQEIFSNTGRHVATFIGPDALEYTWQIKLGGPGEPGGYRPEAFR